MQNVVSTDSTIDELLAELDASATAHRGVTSISPNPHRSIARLVARARTSTVRLASATQHGNGAALALVDAAAKRERTHAAH